MAPRMLPPEQLPTLLSPGTCVYVPGASGESRAVNDALVDAPDRAAGVHFVGVWLPGINRADLAGLHPQARATAFFIGRELRESFLAGRIEFLPLTYSEAFRYLRDRARIDIAVVQVSPPDECGRLSLGIATDFAPAVLSRARKIVAHVNPSMPRTSSAPTIALADVDVVIEADRPLLVDDPVEDPVWTAIGRQIAAKVEDGDTLEVGIGRVQAVLTCFTHARRLRLHSGIITSTLHPLIATGSLADEPGAITTAGALGDEALYRFVAANPLVRFAPVGETHDVATLRRIRRFIAINGVVEVDLLGQANGEMVAGRQVSGAGGIIDFVRGARLSEGGMAVAALPSTAGGGSVSRIVPALSAGTAVAIPRSEIDLVVTEHGVADLRYKGIDARAQALIAIAEPRFRDTLETAWSVLRRKM